PHRHMNLNREPLQIGERHLLVRSDQADGRVGQALPDSGAMSKNAVVCGAEITGNEGKEILNGLLACRKPLIAVNQPARPVDQCPDCINNRKAGDLGQAKLAERATLSRMKPEAEVGSLHDHPAGTLRPEWKTSGARSTDGSGSEPLVRV